MRETRLGRWLQATRARLPRPGSLRRRLVVGVFVLQFLVPLVALVASPAPTRLGFQMYSGVGEVKAHSVDAAGDRETIDLGQIAAVPRPDIDWLTHLPAKTLCEAHTDAVEVVVTQGGKTARHPCARS